MTTEGRYSSTDARALWFCTVCGAVVPVEARGVHDEWHERLTISGVRFYQDIDEEPLILVDVDDGPVPVHNCVPEGCSECRPVSPQPEPPTCEHGRTEAHQRQRYDHMQGERVDLPRCPGPSLQGTGETP